MPPIRRTASDDDEYAAAVAPPKATSTPWIVVVGVLVALLLAGGGYLIASGSGNDDPPPAADSSSSAPVTSDGAAKSTSDGDHDKADPSGDDEAGSSEDSTYGLPTKPASKKDPKSSAGNQPGGAACKASTSPKKQAGKLVQQVTITCDSPAEITIKPKGNAVIEMDGEVHTDEVETCADSVTFTVEGGSYSWTNGAGC